MIIDGETGKLEICITRRINPDTNDYWDANWLESEILILVPGFKAHYKTNLRVDELKKFYKDLIKITEFQITEVKFKAMEEGIILNLFVESKGTLVCIGKATGQDGNCLNFKINFDNTMLENFKLDLRSELKKYKLKGTL